MTHIFHMSQVFSEIEPLTVNTLALFNLVHLVHLTTLGNFRNHSSACKKKIKCSENFRCFITNSLVKGISTILMHSALDSEVLLLFFFFWQTFLHYFCFDFQWVSCTPAHSIKARSISASTYIVNVPIILLITFTGIQRGFFFFFFLPKSTS